MTSNTFRRSRRRTRRRGGNIISLANAASASILPIGLTLSQQYYKNKNRTLNKSRFKRKFKSFTKSLSR